MLEGKVRYWLEQGKWPDDVAVGRGVDLEHAEAREARMSAFIREE